MKIQRANLYIKNEGLYKYFSIFFNIKMIICTTLVDQVSAKKLSKKIAHGTAGMGMENSE
jgi:hypothetical protein